jgi:dimethylargininase
MLIITDYDHAIVRAVPRRYAPEYAKKGVHIDPVLADAQHAMYATALERAGVTLTVIAADEAFYDCVFVEDTAVVWRDCALITRIAEHREGEQRGVAAALGGSHTLSRLSAGSLLEGGDVLHTEQVTYVGLSHRTNQRGADELAAFLSTFGRPVARVPVSNALHLKTVATYLGNGTLLIAPGHLDLHAFDVDEVIETADGEPGSANCVRIGDTLLVPGGYPATRERLRSFAERHSVSVVPLELSEFAKGDGSPTCLSLLWQGTPPRPSR